MLLVLGILPILIMVLGLVLCGISGFEFSGESRRERLSVAVAGMLLVLWGIAGLAWKPLVFFYPFVFFGALVFFAFYGLFRAFKVRCVSKTPH